MLPYCLMLVLVQGSALPGQSTQTPPGESPQATQTAPTQTTQAGPPQTTQGAPARMVEVPLEDCSGLPCIEMSTGDGKTLRLLIDTAESNSYIDTKASQTLGLKTEPLKGAQDIQQTTVVGAKLGDLPMGDFPFFVLDTTAQPDKPGQKAEPLPADGALTYRAFQNRLLQMDFTHRVVRISEPLPAAQACPQTCSDLVVKHVGSAGPSTLTADGFSLNGQPVTAQIDTLFTGTMLVYPEAVEKLGLKKEAKSKHKELFPYVENGIKLARFEGTKQGFHDLTLAEDAPVYFFTPDNTPPAVQFDVTVGRGLLSHATTTFDFKGMHMWMESATGTPAAQ